MTVHEGLAESRGATAAPGARSPLGAGPTPHLIDATMFWNPSGGVQRYIVAKRDWLRARRGWAHTVATPQPDAEAALRVPSLPLPGSGGAYRLPWRRAATAALLRDARPTLIEAADPYRLAWSVLDAAEACGVPALAFCHSNLEQMAGLAAGRFAREGARRAARRYAARLYRRFDLVLAPSRSMLAHLRDWGVEHAVHQPLGVDTGVFRPERASPAWRAALGWPPGARVLLYVGRFAPEKHLATLAAATQRLGAPHWLVAIGAGPMPPAGERVLVLPAIRDRERLAAAIANADVFVHAGAQETFGLSVLEALACGTPVVARAAGGLAELVDASVGEAVAHDDAAAFAEAIAAVLARAREPLARAARARAVALDWTQVLPQLCAHYDRLLGTAAATVAEAACC